MATRPAFRLAETWFVGVLLLLGACGDDDGDSPSTSEPAAEATSDGSTTTGATVAPTIDDSVDVDAPDETDAEIEIELVAPEIRTALGLETMTLLTPTSGGGTRPAFEWEPVDGAFMYSVVLRGPAGRGYWGWEGRETSIHLGGEPVIEEGKPGPSLVEGMSWQVSAYNDDFDMIALSGRRSIGP